MVKTAYCAIRLKNFYTKLNSRSILLRLWFPFTMNGRKHGTCRWRRRVRSIKRKRPDGDMLQINCLSLVLLDGPQAARASARARALAQVSRANTWANALAWADTLVRGPSRRTTLAWTHHAHHSDGYCIGLFYTNNSINVCNSSNHFL